MCYFRSKLQILAIVTVVIGGWSCPSFAANSLDEGKRLYSEKKYSEARAILLKAVQDNPKSWQNHFYLGHTLTALGRYAEAKHQYALCKYSTKNTAVHAHCDRAMKNVDKYSSKLKSSSRKVDKSSAGSAPSKAEEASPTDGQNAPEVTDDADVNPIQARIEAKRKEVIEEAKEKCKAIMAKAEEQIESEKASSKGQYRYTAGSDGKGGLSKERIAQIKKPAEDKCKKIMEIAKRKARSYR